MVKPRVIYVSDPGSPIEADREFYGRLAQGTHRHQQIDRFTVPIRSGRAWPVRAGQLCRIVVVEGAQVADFNAWNLSNPREHFWAARTKQLHRAHVTTYDRLWSCLPYLRPMLTITNDTVQYGIDEDGAGCHDLLGTRCDPYVHRLLNGEDFDYCCHSNLVRAIAPFRLTEADVHDVLNIFQVTALTDDHRYAVKPSPARVGDFFEFFAGDRPPVRHLHIPPGRPVGGRVGTRRYGPAIHVPPPGGGGLPTGHGAIGGMETTPPFRLRWQSWSEIFLRCIKPRAIRGPGFQFFIDLERRIDGGKIAGDSTA